jgi:hypothetical protein
VRAGRIAQGRRGAADLFAADIGIDDQCPDRETEGLQAGVGCADAEFARQQGQQARLPVFAAGAFFIQHAGGLEGFTQAQAHAEQGGVALAERTQAGVEETFQRGRQGQPRFVERGQIVAGAAQGFVQGGAIQAGLVAEIVGDGGDVGLGGLGDFADRGGVVAALRLFVARGRRPFATKRSSLFIELNDCLT